MRELEFQSILVRAANSCNGYGLKLANRHVSGVPDVIIKLPTQPVVFIECKKANLGLSQIQRVTIRKMQRAGMFVGWVVLVDQQPGRYTLHVGAGHDIKKTEPTVNCDAHEFMAQHAWRVDELVQSIIRWTPLNFEV